jgi:hypothetical protein
MGSDNVYFGKYVVKNQIFGLATKIDVPILRKFKWDGILGLGFNSKDLKLKKITPFFDNVIKQNVFTDNKEYNQFG